MFLLTLKTIIVSLMLIGLIHYLYSFFKNSLTNPKVKDLVNKPNQRYNEMFNIINNKNIITDCNNDSDKNVSKLVSEQNMEAELKTFLSELKKPNVKNNSDIHEVNSNLYSTYLI